jgi:hypothetical protein
VSGRDGRFAAVVGVTACAACCAGPILGVLAAIGLTTALGAALFGVGVLLLGAIAVTAVLVRRRWRAVACAPDSNAVAVPVALGTARESLS